LKHVLGAEHYRWRNSLAVPIWLQGRYDLANIDGYRFSRLQCGLVG